MSLNPTRLALVTVFVGDGEYPAALTIGSLIALQDSRDIGPWALYEKLRNQTWRIEDIQESIRHGLIGAGMEHKEAKRLIDTYVQPGRLLEYLPAAITVVHAAIFGPPEDADEGEPEAPTTSQTLTEESSGQMSTSSPEPVD